MDDLVPLPAPALGQAVEAAKGFLAFSKAAATARAYRSDWRNFETWCNALSLGTLPAAPEAVAAYIASLATAGRKVPTINRRLAAIAERHRMAHMDSPTSHALVKATLAGIARTTLAAPIKKAALTADLVGRILRKIPDDLEGARDRAIILIGFAAALRRSELVALDLADIARHPKGIVVTVRRSKTDQEGRGLLKAIPHGRRLKVVEALDTYIARAGIAEGALFRLIVQGCASDQRISDRAVARIVQRRARAAGLDPSLFAGHSLRSGYISTAAEHGAALASIAKHAGHAKLDTTLGYVQVADAFKDHSGSGFL